MLGMWSAFGAGRRHGTKNREFVLREFREDSDGGGGKKYAKK